MSKNLKAKTSKMSDEQFAKLIEKAGEQYHAYKKLHDVVNLALSMSKPEPNELPPSLEYPHITTLSALSARK